MFQKLTEAQIDQSDIWSDDKLNRKEIADQLTRVLGTTDGPLVVSVSSPFGMGKSFFAKRWVADLNQSKIAVYFNAWETDYSDSPLVAFIECLRAELDSLDMESAKKAKIADRFGKAVKAGAPALARTAAKAVLRAGGYVLVGDKVDEVADAAIKGVIEEAERIATAQIDAFATERSAREKFRFELTRLRNAIFENTASGSRRQSEDQKIYIVVDELDRCRPLYALEFLESVKHLFDIPGYIFVIMIDEAQLNLNASRLYGVNPSGEGYIRKFIDYRFRLPNPSHLEMSSYLYEYFAIDEICSNENPDSIYGKDRFISGFSYFSRRLGLSLRAQSHAFALVGLVLRGYGKTFMPLLACLACVRERHSDVWSRFLSVGMFDQDALELLGYDPYLTRKKDRELFEIQKVMRVFLASESLREYERFDHDRFGNLRELEQYSYRLWCNLHLDISEEHRFNVVRELVSKIEMSAEFQS